MEPFGPGNCKPVLLLKNVCDTGYAKVVKEQHLRITVGDNGTTFGCIGFNLAHHFPLVQNKRPVDIVLTLDMNEWNGARSLQLKVIDVRGEA